MPRNAEAARPQPAPNDEAPIAVAERPALNPEDTDPEVAEKKKRRRLVIAVAAAVVVLGGLVYYLYGRRFEDTDDAEVDANISSIGSRVGGTVTRVNVAENQRVHAGDVIAEIDPTDLQVALAQKKAAVAEAQAQLAIEDPSVPIAETSNASALSNASANISSASAGLASAAHDADQAAARLTEAQANQRTADLDLRRGEELVKSDAIPRADFDRRQSAASAAAAVVSGARDALEGARSRVEQQKALMSGIRSRLDEVRKNSPREVDARKASVLYRQANLELARAEEHQAELNLGYASVRTPVAGIVARRAVNIGDTVAPGQALAAIAQTDETWVTANFRETQLRRMRPGQRVTAHVDALDLTFTGSVESLGGATGSRVSVLPPENATGNYVKVVQRIPVRVRLDPGQDGLDLLRPGMSVEPKVRVAP
jgi:membrane fusion protein (multidrug efflux system)